MNNSEQGSMIRESGVEMGGGLENTIGSIPNKNAGEVKDVFLKMKSISSGERV